MGAHLFESIKLGGLTLPNRVIVAPMCQYQATDGNASDWHSVHWGQYALANAGLFIIEATGVTPEGRITPECLGLYNDENEAAFARSLKVARAVSNARIGIQLGHAGRKASTLRPWDGNGHHSPDARGWEVVGPSAVAFAENWPVPRALSETDIEDTISAFVSAAQRAVRLGIDAIEIHAAHGYLLSSFLSPLANHREDHYGGSLENRMRLPLQVFKAVRAVCPAHMPVGVRFNGTDWLDGGFDGEQAVAFAAALHALGCDYVDISTGGNGFAKIPVGPAYQVPFATQIKQQTGMATMAVGLIRAPEHAEAILANGQADMISIGRGFLNNPRWVWHAAETLGVELEVAPSYRFGATRHYRPTWGR